MSAPANAENVSSAIRLGWGVSELRGRLRPGQKLIVVAPITGQLRADHALPLGGERSEVEQLIEAEAIVNALAAKLGLDVDCAQLTGQAAHAGTVASKRLEALSVAWAAAADHTADDTARRTAWAAIAAFLYDWDATMQDLLAGGAFSQSSAYQLGRGLGEIAWLDPTQFDAGVATSWTFVLGERRVEPLVRLARRLGDYFSAYSGAAVAASLDHWQVAAAEIGKRKAVGDDTKEALVEQTKRWRDVLLTGLDATTYLPPDTLLKRARRVRTVLKSFWPELLLGSVFALLLSGAAAWYTSASNHHGWATFLAILGALGVTASSLTARAKNEAHALISQLQRALDADLVLEAVEVKPPRSAVLPAKVQEGAVR